MAAKKAAAPEVLSVVVSLDGVFGFIGKLVAAPDDGFVHLENALSVGYNEDGTPRLGLNQIPLGLVDPKFVTTTLIPKSNVSYIVSFNASDEHGFVTMYKKFFEDLAI